MLHVNNLNSMTSIQSSSILSMGSCKLCSFYSESKHLVLFQGHRQYLCINISSYLELKLWRTTTQSNNSPGSPPACEHIPNVPRRGHSPLSHPFLIVGKHSARVCKHNRIWAAHPGRYGGQTSGAARLIGNAICCLQDCRFTVISISIGAERHNNEMLLMLLSYSRDEAHNRRL